MVVKENLTAINTKAEVNLLVYFQNGYEKRFSQQESTNEGFPFVRIMPGDQESEKDRYNDKKSMEGPYGAGTDIFVSKRDRSMRENSNCKNLRKECSFILLINSQYSLDNSWFTAINVSFATGNDNIPC